MIDKNTLEEIADAQLKEQLDDAYEQSKTSVLERELNEKLDRELEEFDLGERDQVDEVFFMGCAATARLFACLDRVSEREGWTADKIKQAKKVLEKIIFAAEG